MDLNSQGSIAQYSWAPDNAALILRVATGANQFSYFVLDGDPLPAFASASAYNTFIAGLTDVTSLGSEMAAGITRPGYSMYPSTLTGVTTSQDDVVIGGVGNDWSVNALKTGIGNDAITGLAIKDIVYAGAGHDTVEAGAGNDSIFAGTGNDQLGGGDGMTC
ncbi:calcium-binding protein [Gemmobacter lanyuensis]